MVQTAGTTGGQSVEEELTEAGFAITPPPGFTRVPTDKPSNRRAAWRRGGPKKSHGIELLTVSRTGNRLDKPTGRLLAKIAETITKSSVPAGATGVQVSARALAPARWWVQAETYRAHEEGTSRQHSIFRWFTDEQNEVVMVAIGASQEVPMEQLEEDAAAVVDSYRSLGKAKKDVAQKKWWDFFR